MNIPHQMYVQLGSYMSSPQRNAMFISVSQEVERVVIEMNAKEKLQIPYITSTGMTVSEIRPVIVQLAMYMYSLPTFKSFGLTFPARFDALFSTSMTASLVRGGRRRKTHHKRR